MSVDWAGGSYVGRMACGFTIVRGEARLARGQPRKHVYAGVDIVTKARTALCKQMGALFLRQWRLNHHVCENFSPKKDATECTGMHFYHWGALASFIGLIDADF